MFGTNGGGFFNVNSAHPFENPTKITDFIGLYAILIIPFALAFTFGRMIRNKRQGYAVFIIMFVLWLGAGLAAVYLEAGGNPRLESGGVTQAVTRRRRGQCRGEGGQERTDGVGARGVRRSRAPRTGR